MGLTVDNDSVEERINELEDWLIENTQKEALRLKGQKIQKGT